MPAAPARRASWVRSVCRNPAVAIGGFVLLLLVAMAVFAPYITYADPEAVAPVHRKQGPCAMFWFGTDILGRDIFSRVVFGARISLIVGSSVALLACAAGLVVGGVAGYFRWADNVLMRIMDGMMAIPSILLAIAMIALSHAGVWSVVIAITITEIPRVARFVRGNVLTIRGQLFIEAAVASGTRPARILARHVFPNLVSPLAVQATFICAAAILLEAALSFLGAGIPPNIPSWGNIMAEGRGIWQTSPHTVLFPALFLTATVLSMNVLGDGVRDFLDPQMNRRD
ncbi:ABC transporter permease [Ramlibacter sp.]|uniref:ABC transporter permease n=1 Tax=Ramlibacter sp. TaxID=1917967 RepID=UPI0039C9038E